MDNKEFFDKERVYDEKIAPLISQILKICQEEDIPMIASFKLKDETEENGEMLCTSYILPKDHSPTKYVECKNIIYRRSSFMAMTIRSE
ncbi:hypothetical protein ACFVS2_21765 [Brevibacillus sp. NPDC058079]|uniref:hypothetical protein n=1 Tax=Brevibacillus sp. NPDC058079 TaxID=3346330 RepID=UPI0036EEB89B